MGSFLVPSVFLDRFNTTWALAFLIPFLHYWTPTPSLHYSQINCLWFFSLLVHFLFVVNWEILFNHPDLPLPLFDPSFTCSNSWTWKMSIFSINELSWNSLTYEIIFHEVLSSTSQKRLKAAPLKYVILTLVLFLLLRILHSCMIFAAVAALAFTRQILLYCFQVWDSIKSASVGSSDTYLESLPSRLS